MDFTKPDRVFIVAELSANHNGSIDTAVATIKAAAQAGADAIKLQTYTAGTITLNCRLDDFKLKQGTIWDGKYLYELYEEAFTPWEWHEQLYRIAREEGLVCFSSPFDKTAVDFLESLDNPVYKVASFEITDIPLIEYIAEKQKPVIISTGVATEEDIHLALDACRAKGNNQLALLKCTSAYPSPIEEQNLVMIRDLAMKFGVVSGLSDHTPGITAPVVAVAMGARIIEKHFILNRSIGGPDASFSLTAEEFKAMVEAVRQAEKAIGMVDYSLTEKQKKAREFSRSLYVCENVTPGEVLTEKNVRSVRPGFGMHPKYLKKVLGKKFNQSVEKGTRLTPDLFE